MSTAVYTLPDVVVKRYTGESRWKQAKELSVYALLAEAPGVPSIVDVDTAHGVTVMTRVPGEPLAFAPAEAMADLYRQLGELLAAIHVVEWSGPFASCTGPVLCHNDLHEGNVLVAPAGDSWRVTGFVDVENAIAADPLMDLAKTIQYERTRSPAKVAGLLAGYGPLTADGPARIELYRLYQALELWDWFAEIGNVEPLAGIAEDIRELVSP